MVYLVVSAIALFEAIIFTQYPIMGVVLPASIVLLMIINERVGFWQLLLSGVIVGFILDSLRSSYAPYLLIAYTLIAIVLGLWKKYRKRPVGDRIVRPLIFLFIAVAMYQTIIVLPIYEAVDIQQTLTTTAWTMVLLGLLWLSTNFVIKRYWS